MKTKLFVALALVTVLSLMMMATASAALPTNMSWVKYGSNPVVNSSLCYSGDHVRPALVRESANNYKMYISDRHNGSQIYLATSSDGGLTWSCGNGGSPVLTLGTGGAWDNTRLQMASVLKEGTGDYKMWYVGRNSSAVWGIGYATSNDGISWTKWNTNGGPVLTAGAFGAWDSLRVEDPTVINVAGTYHMWYSGEKTFPYDHIGHATAGNPQGPWAKDAGNPVFNGTPATWDANEVYSPYVVVNGAAYEMFYSGENGNLWLTGHASATNPNGPWTKDPNAILSPGSTGWEAGTDSLDYAGAVLDGTTWKVFYSLGGTYQVGLATLQSTPQLTFSPLATSVAVGSDVTINIDLTSVTGLYGYQFQVSYDSTKVSATAQFVDSFFSTTPDAFIVWNRDCTTAGVCKFAVTKTLPATYSTGSGTLAQITFHGLAAGDVPLTFSSDILSNKEAAPMTHTSNTGFLTVYGTATLSGTVTLQGRATPIDSGTVTLSDENGIVPQTVVNFSATDGSWNATVPVAGSTTYTILAHHSLYLDNQETGVPVSAGGSYPQPTTKLLGGDADNSGKIDVSDLTCIGGSFGGAPVVCGTTGSSDINKDLTVNILDLVLAGGNYGLIAPQPW